MGLDMYLSKRNHIGNKWRKKSEMVKVKIPKNQSNATFPTKDIKNERISEIVEEVGYWRKANQIHAWFVANVQEGNDDCEEYYVSKEAGEKLLAEINKALEFKPLANKILPTQSGFFFGNEEYDEYYFEDLKQTKEILEGILAEGWQDIYYRSSW